MRTGGNIHAVCRICQKGGSQRWLQIDGKCELTDTGEPSRVVGVVADITEHKALEQEAKELSERLVTLQEEERQRITQELHDSTAQHLVAANLNLMRLRSKAGSGSDDRRLWDEVEASMEETFKELRTFSYLMHPSGSTHRWIALNHPTIPGRVWRPGRAHRQAQVEPDGRHAAVPDATVALSHNPGGAGQCPASRVRIACLRRLAMDRRSAAFGRH